MTQGISGRILNAHSKNDIKEIDVIFESKGIQYEINGLKMVLSGNPQNEYRIYRNGKCIQNNVESEQVSLRVLFSQPFPLTHHIAIDDFANQEADLYLN